jgi:hypothetical protein
MVAEETSQENAFETTLTAPMGPTDLIAAVVTKGTLTSPALIVIEPDDDLQREIIRFNGVFGGSTFVTQNVSFRYLPGSAAPSGLTHPSGAIVRSTPTAQHIEDIHDRIDALDHGDDLAGLADDDHTQYHTDARGDARYVELGGDTMTGDLILNDAPTVALEAATKAYADLMLPLAGGVMTGDITLDADPDAALKAATKQYVDAGTLPSGTRMIFDQDSAPTGWTRDISTVDDKVIRIVTGARADGGTWTQPDHTHTNPTSAGGGSHTHAGPNHNHSGPNHNHTNPSTGPSASGGGQTAVAEENGGATFEYSIFPHTHTGQGNTGNAGTGVTGGGGTGQTDNEANHTHTQGATGGSATVSNWRPLHRDMILCSKD